METKSPIIPLHNRPTEIYQIVVDVTAMNAIPANVRFEGRKCVVVANDNEYRLVGGVANANWVVVNSGVGAGILIEDIRTVDAGISAAGFIDLAQAPNTTIGHLSVFYDGFMNIEGAGDDYTRPTSTRINFNYPLTLGAKLKIKYTYI